MRLVDAYLRTKKIVDLSVNKYLKKLHEEDINMTLKYRNSTDKDNLKCNALQANKLQCAHKLSKVLISDVIPTEINIVNATPNNPFGLCQAHFNILLSRIKIAGNTLIDLDNLKKKD